MSINKKGTDMIKLTQLFLLLIFTGASVGIHAQPSAPPLTSEELMRLHAVKAWDIEFTYHSTDTRIGSGDVPLSYGFNIGNKPIDHWTLSYSHEDQYVLKMTVAGKNGQSDCAPGADSCIPKYDYPGSITNAIETFSRFEEVHLTNGCPEPPDGNLTGPGIQTLLQTYTINRDMILDGTGNNRLAGLSMEIDYSYNPPRAFGLFYTLPLDYFAMSIFSGCYRSDTSLGVFSSGIYAEIYPYNISNPASGDTYVRIENGSFVIRGSSTHNQVFNVGPGLGSGSSSNIIQIDGGQITIYREWVIREHPDSTITVTKPSAGDLLIAGEPNKIEWIGGSDIDSLKITAILNWHTVFPTEFLVSESVPADAEEFEWNIPDTLLSYKTKIKIEDKNDPTNFAESESFRLKGYVLTRVNTIDLTYQKFDRTTHAWRFGNATNNMWPSTWWSQFTYDQTSIDPYSNDFYSEDFNGVHQSFFPDWLAFVRAFGANQCYWSVPLLGLTYRQNAINNWKSRWGVWGGSCFGIATSSLMAFTDVNTYVATYPEMPPFNNLFQFSTPLSGIQGDSIRAIINSLQIHQSGKQHQTFIGNLGNDTPLQTLNKIKSSIIEDNGDIGPLLIYNQGTGGGAHAIVVYKLIKSTLFANTYTLFVYDNSYATNLFAQITIDTVANRWNAPLWAGWGGTNGILIADPGSSYFNQPILPNGPLDNSQLNKSLTGSTLNENTKSEVYVSRNLDIVLSDTLGNSIGFKDSVIFNTIPNAYPILFAETYYTPPSGYHIPAGKYKVDISAINDSLVNFYFFEDSVTYLYRRFDASSNQTDHLYIDSGLSITSYDQGIKSIELETTIANSEYEKVFQLRDIKLSASDSIEIKENANDGVTVKNFGIPKSYGFKVKYNSNEFIKLFKYEGVTLAQNSSHVFQPDWASLDSMALKIFIDNGNDEVIDDSMFIENQATRIGDDQGSLISPNSYNLAQNYPNPFNPVTTIKYSIPTSEFVTVKVYDVLGNQIETLVDEYKLGGSYEVNFDASNLSSGVYFYKIQAGEYINVKKMILLR